MSNRFEEPVSCNDALIIDYVERNVVYQQRQNSNIANYVLRHCCWKSLLVTGVDVCA